MAPGTRTSAGAGTDAGSTTTPMTRPALRNDIPRAGPEAHHGARHDEGLHALTEGGRGA